MRENDIIFVHSRRAETSRRCDLFALPGQSLAIRKIRLETIKE